MKHIVIVGATSGIGRATAHLFISKGWTVGVAGRRTEKLEELRRLAPDRVFSEPIDVNEPDAPAHLLSLVHAMQSMDVFLLCSGIGSQNAELRPDIELATVRTNGEGFTRLVCAAWEYFRAQRSMGVFPRPRQRPYCRRQFHRGDKGIRRRSLLFRHKMLPELLLGGACTVGKLAAPFHSYHGYPSRLR